MATPEYMRERRKDPAYRKAESVRAKARYKAKVQPGRDAYDEWRRGLWAWHRKHGWGVPYPVEAPPRPTGWDYQPNKR